MNAPFPEALEGRLKNVKRSGDGWIAQCPGHEDQHASLTVGIGDDGRILLCDQSKNCTFEKICAAMDVDSKALGPSNGNGHRQREIIATYDYVNAENQLLYQVVRFSPKDFRQRRPDPDRRDEWLWKLGNVHRVLYRLPEVIDAVRAGKRIYPTEGEKDADNLSRHGLTATCNVAGAGKWRAEYSEVLRGADVAILVDADGPGRKHGQQVAQSLHGIAKTVRVIELPGPGKDVSDWLGAGHTIEELDAIVNAAPLWEPSAEPEEPHAITVDELKATVLTELASANRLRKHHGDALRHARGLGWLVWDGRRWAPSDKAAARMTHDLGELIRKEGASAHAPEVVRAYYAHARAVEKAQGITAILTIAKSLEGIDGDHVEWDADPWALNVANGTLDLRTGKIWPHRKEDYNTKLCPTPYNPNATAPRWKSFLREVFSDDLDVITYWQWLCGYCLTGCTMHDLFVVAHGAGANGKTTALRTIQNILGEDYSQQIDPEDLLMQKHARHSTGLAALRGTRLVICQETAPGRRLNEPLVKGLTGGDKIRARLIGQDGFEFVPSMKLIMCSNHRPTIRDDSRGMWRRIRLIPFERSFEGDSAGHNLFEKLTAEAPGILSWAVRGAQQVAQGEPPLPAEVKAATNAYEQEQDALGAFMDECCILGPCEKIEKSKLYAVYQGWCQSENCDTKMTFSARLRERGLDEFRATGGTRCWQGISLQDKGLDHAER